MTFGRLILILIPFFFILFLFGEMMRQKKRNTLRNGIMGVTFGWIKAGKVARLRALGHDNSERLKMVIHDVSSTRELMKVALLCFNTCVVVQFSPILLPWACMFGVGSFQLTFVISMWLSEQLWRCVMKMCCAACVVITIHMTVEMVDTAFKSVNNNIKPAHKNISK